MYIRTILAKQQGEYIAIVADWTKLPTMPQIQQAIVADAAKHLHETKPKRPMRLRKRSQVQKVLPDRRARRRAEKGSQTQ